MLRLLDWSIVEKLACSVYYMTNNNKKGVITMTVFDGVILFTICLVIYRLLLDVWRD